MEGDRWSALSPMLDELLELTDRSRAQRLSEFAASDPALAEELSRLAALEANHPDFLPCPRSKRKSSPCRRASRPSAGLALGRRRNGLVWLAVRADGLHERRVALKLLREALSDVGLHARFTASDRSSPPRATRTCPLLETGISHDGQPYLALDYVRGEPITEYVQKRGLDLAARRDCSRRFARQSATHTPTWWYTRPRSRRTSW
jgi:serine/threonine-protein kinase